nr:PfkB family carbohydrate kinase [uncultured Caproiciproducens sp.]
MTNREQEIIELIRINPMITQNELSEKLSITRSSVAVHITNLMKKGVIKGKCYILNDDPYVCVVGGANMDIQGFPREQLVMNDSNPGKVKISFGGVGRNIAENISRLGIQTKLITAVGNDDYGKSLLEAAGKCGMDTKHSLISDEYPTPIYLSILDGEGDMKVAISQMNVLEKINVDFIENRRQLIKRAQLCVIDTNLPENTIAFLTQEFPEMDFYLDTVSTAKAVKARDILGRLHTIKPNRLEAEKLSGIKIADEGSLRRSGEFFLEQGVKRVVISLGSKGTYYRDGKTEFILETEKVKVVNATGAGDAFMAGLVYGSLHNMEPVEIIKLSAAASKLALSHENTINPDMSVENIEKMMEENDHVKRLS